MIDEIENFSGLLKLCSKLKVHKAKRSICEKSKGSKTLLSLTLARSN